jgi:hypothetical protein
MGIHFGAQQQNAEHSEYRNAGILLNHIFIHIFTIHILYLPYIYLPYIVTRFNELAYIMAISPQFWLDFIWRLFGFGKETDKILGVLKGLSQKVQNNNIHFCELKSKKKNCIWNLPNSQSYLPFPKFPKLYFILFLKK